MRADVAAVVGEPDTDIVEVDTGYAVAPAVDEHEPDLVIVDLQMGNMGGMAVCLELRLEESYGNLPHVPVLMLLDRRPDVFLAKRSGAEGWIVKPLDPIRLRKATTALHRRRDLPRRVVSARARPGGGRCRARRRRRRRCQRLTARSSTCSADAKTHQRTALQDPARVAAGAEK